MSRLFNRSTEKEMRIDVRRRNEQTVRSNEQTNTLKLSTRKAFNEYTKSKDR